VSAKQKSRWAAITSFSPPHAAESYRRMLLSPRGLFQLNRWCRPSRQAAGSAAAAGCDGLSRTSGREVDGRRESRTGLRGAAKKNKKRNKEGIMDRNPRLTKIFS